jgi:hypothetical protein
MVKRANGESEFLCELEHREHVIGSVAVGLDQDVPAQDFCQCFQGQIPVRAVRRSITGQPEVPFFPVLLSPYERFAIARHIAHPGGRPGTLVDSFGILPACHLESHRRAAHPLPRFPLPLLS